MLYSKNVRKICAYCIHAQSFSREHELCLKRGPVTAEFTCPRFVYDPLRRRPARPVKLKMPGDDAYKL